MRNKPSSTAGILLAGALLSSSACSLKFNVPPGHVLCKKDSDCPTGSVCEAIRQDAAPVVVSVCCLKPGCTDHLSDDTIRNAMAAAGYPPVDASSEAATAAEVGPYSDTRIPPDVGVRPDAQTLPDAVVGPEAQTSPDAVVGPDAPTSPDGVVGPEAQTSPDAVAGPDARTSPDAAVPADVPVSPPDADQPTPDATAAADTVVSPDVSVPPDAPSPDAPISPDSAPDRPLAAQGGACQFAGECGTGKCVDGFCCDGACDGVCESCAGAAWGIANGTCTPIPAGQDPDDDCSFQDRSTCGTTGVCDGKRACAKYPSGSVCKDGTCDLSSNSYIGWNKCDSLGNCTMAGSVACGPYLCGNSGCPMFCAAGGPQCASGNYCDAGTCKPVKENGASCSLNIECKNGFCADGFCCNEACTGTCRACAAKWTVAADGVCSNVKGIADPHGQCPTTAASTCGTNGWCDGAGSCAFYGTQTTCASPFCDGNVFRPGSSCDGSGICVNPGFDMFCGVYACTLLGCGTSCTTVEDCASGYVCTKSACLKQCSTTADCLSLGAYHCDGTVCRPNCGGLECPKGEHCDTSSGLCVVASYDADVPD
jgi:hypothetical protein